MGKQLSFLSSVQRNAIAFPLCLFPTNLSVSLQMKSPFQTIQKAPPPPPPPGENEIRV